MQHLALALQLAQNLGLDMDIMSELLQVGISGMVNGLNRKA
jgi:hypothetical protein